MDSSTVESRDFVGSHLATLGSNAETPIRQLKRLLGQLEWKLSRLAVCHGLGYGHLQDLASAFLQVQSCLARHMRHHTEDHTLVELGQHILDNSSRQELQQFEQGLLAIRRLAEDPGQATCSQNYRTLMAQLLDLETGLQMALQASLQCEQ